MKKNKSLNTSEIVLMGLMIALVFLAGSVIKIPTFGGFVQFGDCMVFLSVILLGKKKGAVSSGLGMFLVDVLGGYYFWAPFTLLIKFGMAYIAGSLIEKIPSNKTFIKYIVAFSAGGIFMVIAYFGAGIILASFLTNKLGLIQGIIFASKDVVSYIVQVTAGIIIALPLSTILVRAKKSIFAN